MADGLFVGGLMFGLFKKNKPEASEGTNCIVCMNTTKSPCITAEFNSSPAINGKISMCRECGHSIVDAGKYFDENPPETANESEQQEEDWGVRNIPYAQKGQIKLECSWCGADKVKTPKIFNVRLIYEIDAKGERVFFFPNRRWCHERVLPNRRCFASAGYFARICHQNSPALFL